jgi:hypothetical protein
VCDQQQAVGDFVHGGFVTAGARATIWKDIRSSMNEPSIGQIGELPRVDLDLGSTGKQFTRKIRENVLKGNWPAQDRNEEQMVRDFKASKLTVGNFLAKKEKGEI